ncbi:dienelactone hydrolase family protein [Hymenobacter sp. 15J16-1T3B]|uniref:alpha/beta hydrolase n=1 Tax=Hymenobacter sp. 15J16-1T3B TaxID=2886941 RepID=UPI001D129070|nr:dienelactone hydrolase family protein [Hymenobacter sp. 15J16-1T3B]MCC3156486.1 dienelactone hydrolase family protein [Hymenobacter sp. 15J16-1T3B]
MPVANPPLPPLLTDLPLPYRLVTPAQAPGAHCLVLLLHGVGGNELNLLPVGAQLADARTLVLSVRAPLVFGPAGFGFYQVDFSTGQPVYDQAQQQRGQELLLRFIGEATARYGVPAGQVYLLGFSQGAIMAYDVALRHPGQVRGVLAFSGRLLEESRQHHAPAAEVQRVQFFLSHGRHDNTLPAFYADQAAAFLRTLGVAPHYEAFEGGHEISGAGLAAARQWLGQQP